MNNGIQEYTAEGKYATEEEAKVGLDTCGYPGKWRKAKDSVNLELSPARYWDAVRLYFLELGGCWLTQKPFNSGPPAGWVDPNPRARLTPTFEYREPQKVRFA